MIYLPWAAEFILECSGAYFSYRKRLKILSALLAWRALMDVVTFCIFIKHLHSGYGFTMWAGRATQYALLYALGVQLASKMIQDYRPITQYVYKTLAIGASAATYVFVTTELWEHKFLRAEAITDFLLLAIVLVGWIGRKRGLEEPWRLIGVALCVACAGNALCAILAQYFPIALTAYPLPSISALILWNLAGIERKKIRLREIALDLPPRMPVESVRLTDEDEQWLRGLRISG